MWGVGDLRVGLKGSNHSISNTEVKACNVPRVLP